MIPKRPAPDFDPGLNGAAPRTLTRAGNRFSEKIMLNKKLGF
jgi:hypothetical protein